MPARLRSKPVPVPVTVAFGGGDTSTLRGALAGETFPAGSVCTAVTVDVPPANVASCWVVHVPEASAVTSTFVLAPSVIRTCALGSAVPLRIGNHNPWFAPDPVSTVEITGASA